MCEIAVLSLLLLSLVVEGLTFGFEAVRSGNTAVVNCAHGLVALVAGQLHLVVLHDILFHNRVAALAVLQA